MNGSFGGILLMTLAMAGFAIEDMFVKLSSSTLPIGQILLSLGVFGTVFFEILALARGRRGLLGPGFLHPAVLARNLGEIVGTVAFVSAITLAQITTATAVFQALPLAVTLGAALFLGEKVGWRRWSAITVGFIGVIVIIRPGLAGFDPMALWSVVAVLGLALRDLATRRVPPTVDTLRLAGWGMATMAVTGAAMLVVGGGGVAPAPGVWLWLIGAMVSGAMAYWALTEATRMAEAGATTSFRYARLLFALVIGAVVFGERPDLWTWVGSALIVGSGLYTLARERRLNRLSTRGPTG